MIEAVACHGDVLVRLKVVHIRESLDYAQQVISADAEASTSSDIGDQLKEGDDRAPQDSNEEEDSRTECDGTQMILVSDLPCLFDVGRFLLVVDDGVLALVVEVVSGDGGARDEVIEVGEECHQPALAKDNSDH